MVENIISFESLVEKRIKDAEIALTRREYAKAEQAHTQATRLYKQLPTPSEEHLRRIQVLFNPIFYR